MARYVIRCCDDLSYVECCGYPQYSNTCGDGEELCNDGVCRPEGLCVNGVNCPVEYPYRCSNEECVSDPSQCMTNPVCRDGWVNCGNGLCAPSYGDCKMFLIWNDICTDEVPVLCADGTCAATMGMVSVVMNAMSVMSVLNVMSECNEHVECDECRDDCVKCHECRDDCVKCHECRDDCVECNK